MKGSALSPALVARLRENTLAPEGLHHLDISNSNVGPAELSLLADSIKFNGNNIEGMAPLISIDASSNSICGVTYIEKGVLEIEGLSEFCSCLTSLNKNSRLRKLNLSKNHLALAGFGVVSNFLAIGPSSITELYLRNCAGGHEAIERLVDGLKANKSLQVLDLRDNPIGSTGASFLSEYMSSALRLKQLFLSHCLLGPAGCSAIFQSLHNNGGLELLSISDNQCGNEACEAISHCLRVNTKLRSLELQENAIGNSGVATIAKGIAKNRSLVYLGLQWNDFDNAGAMKLVEVMPLNSTLRGLHLVGTFVDELGVQALMEASTVANERPVDIDIGAHFRPASRVRRRNPGRQSAAENDLAAMGLLSTEGEATETVPSSTET